MFSKNALESIDNIDCQIDNMFEFADGKIEKYYYNSPSTSESYNYGGYKKEREWWNYFYINNVEFEFYFIDCTNDNVAKDNVGLKSIRIFIKSNDFDSENFKNHNDDLGISVF